VPEMAEFGGTGLYAKGLDVDIFYLIINTLVSKKEDFRSSFY